MMWRNYSACGESSQLKDLSTPSLMRNIYQKAMTIYIYIRIYIYNQKIHS